MHLFSVIRLSLSFTKEQHRNVHIHVHAHTDRETGRDRNRDREIELVRQINIMIVLSFELDYCINNPSKWVIVLVSLISPKHFNYM